MRFRIVFPVALFGLLAMPLGPAVAQNRLPATSLPQGFDGGDSVACVHPGIGFRRCDPAGVVGSVAIAGRGMEARARDRINVLDAPYGAKCDGVADDTAPIQAAFIAAAAVPNGAVLELPQRSCLITSTINQTIATGHSVHLRGAGGMSGITSPNGAGIYVTLTGPASSFDASDLAFMRTGSNPGGVALTVQALDTQLQAISRFRSLIFSGNSAVGGTASWAEGLKLVGLSAPVVDGVRTLMPDGTGSGIGYGLHLLGLDTSHYLTDAKVSNSLFQGGHAGILVDRAVQGAFISNSEVIGADYGIQALDPGGTMLQEAVIATGNHFNTSLAGVYLGSSNQAQVSNNLFLHFAGAPGVAWQAILADHSGYHVITGNGLQGTAQGGETFFKAIGGSQLYTITGNNVINLSGYCVDTSAASNAVVTGNSCQAVTEPGIVLGATSLASANIVNGRNELVGPFTGLAQIKGAGLVSTNGLASFSSAQVTASGTTQADATALTATYSFLVTVPSGSGVRLPAAGSLPAGARTDVIIYNYQSTAVRLYPAAGETILGNAANAFVPINASTEMTCRFVGAGTTWVCRAS